MDMYERLHQAADSCDVLLNYGGRNIHPEFLKYLNTFNVYSCFDDPDSSAHISHDVAGAFDAVFVGNIASGFQYHSWGCERTAFAPIFTSPRAVPTEDEQDSVLGRVRDNDIILCCGNNGRRRRRLEMLADAFPQAKCFGRNWENGSISTDKLRHLYRTTKVGWNVHNSTGPINTRLFELAAHGVVQVCDNKTGLGQIFELGREVAGGDTIPEMIELTRHYLAREDERLSMATAALQRYWRDYHAAAIWQRVVGHIEGWLPVDKRGAEKQIAPRRLAAPAALGRVRRQFSYLFNKGVKHIGRQVEKALRTAEEGDIPYDERFYLGEPVSYQDPRWLRRMRRPPRLGDQSAVDSIDHRGALCWALTALIGNQAKRILAIGSEASWFARLAAVDPCRRVIYVGERRDSTRVLTPIPEFNNVSFRAEGVSKHEGWYDLLVCLNPAHDVDEIRGLIRHYGGMAARVIFLACNTELGKDMTHRESSVEMRARRTAVPDDIYAALSEHFEKVQFFYMPDIYVPWLEPMTKFVQGVPLIIECVPRIEASNG